MPSIDECNAKIAAFFKDGGNFTDPEGQRLYAALQQAEVESNNKRFRPESSPPGATPLTEHYTQSHVGVERKPRAFGASITSCTIAARKMGVELQGQVEKVQDKLGRLHRHADTKKEALEMRHSDYEHELFKNKQREVNIARLQFELDHSRQYILPEYELEKTTAHKDVAEVKRKIEKEQEHLDALHVQASFANICAEDLRSLCSNHEEHPLAKCQMSEAKTLLNFKLKQELRGKKLEFREQLEAIDLKYLYHAVDWMYGLGFRDHPEVQESGLPGCGIPKNSVTKKMLVNSLTRVFKLKSSAELQPVPEE